MWGDDQRLGRVLTVAAVAVLAVAVLQTDLPSSSDEDAAPAEAGNGSIVVEQVTNNYTDAAQVYVSPVDGPSLVDPFVPLLDRDETAGPATLQCTSQWGEATELRVLARTVDEGDTIADRRVALEPGDCQPGGGAVFDAAVQRDGNVTIARRS